MSRVLLSVLVFFSIGLWAEQTTICGAYGLGKGDVTIGSENGKASNSNAIAFADA